MTSFSGSFDPISKGVGDLVVNVIYFGRQFFLNIQIQKVVQEGNSIPD